MKAPESEKNLTPLMKQYWDIKSVHADKILLFRMGDFFEMFHEDAIKAAPLLGIALTSRNKKSADETPMCGVPHHSIAGPIHKLLQAGLRVAICDQIEDAKFAKGLVKRAVTRILTPGMVYDSETLAADTANYIACYADGNLAFVDPSSGEAFYFPISLSEVDRVLALFPVAEFLPKDSFGELKPDGTLPLACQQLLAYVRSLGGDESLAVLRPFSQRSFAGRMWLTPTVIRHLEIFSTYEGESTGSLFSAIDRTVTALGKRRLRQALTFPLTNQREIELMQERVRFWGEDLARLKKIREGLAQVGDLERRVGKLSTPQCGGRDLLALASSCAATGQVLLMLGKKSPELNELTDRIQRTLVDDPPLAVKQGYLIREGFDQALDQWIELSSHSQKLLQQMEEREKKETGISSLKIRYNNVFGYYIEVTHTHQNKVPARYLRKQTLANAERYYTEELLELEKKLLSAHVRRFELEFQIFENLRLDCLKFSNLILSLAQEVAATDLETSFSWLQKERNYSLPKMGVPYIRLFSSRHPVLEQINKKRFIANDIEIAESGAVLLTGPNMAGKSTLMRQVALSCVLAQIGAPVPALAAELPILQSIWTRIGASDQLSKGLSTFMVEMTETAEMLKHASQQSLVILDEVGRGTSTYDGLSLAQAILEYLLNEKKSFVLFATHYHELTAMEARFNRLKNAHMKIAERGEIQFLYTLAFGPAKKSYGIKVAALAGVPSTVVERAQSLLENFEKKPRPAEQGNSQMDLFSQAARPEEIPEDSDYQLLREKIKTLPISHLTPLAALNFLSELQASLGQEPGRVIADSVQTLGGDSH